MNRRRLLCQALSTSLLSGLWPGVSLGAERDRQQRLLRFSCTFVNPLERELSKQRFFCFLPADTRAGQRLTDLKISTAFQLHKDAQGHNILELSFERFPPLAQKVVHLSTEVELPLLAGRPLAGVPTGWLGAERFVEVDDPRIQKLAQGLRRSNERKTAKAIYEWVRDNLEYAGYLAEDLGALHALSTGKGDCTEYAALVVALARALGMPARMLGGYVVDRDIVIRPQDFHNWAELYFEEAWQLADAQKANWLQAPEQYVVFRIYGADSGGRLDGVHRYRMDGELNVLL